MILRRGTGLLAGILLLAAVGLPAWGQASKLTAFIQPDRGVTEDQAVQLVIQIDGRQAPSVKPPALNGLTNLRVVGGPSTNSSFVWTGGKASSKFQLIYTLLAEGPGPAVIPAIHFELNGEPRHTDEIRFDVAASQGGSAGGRPSQAGAARGGEVFLKAELAKETVWVGEPVGLTVTLFAAARISSPVWRQQPTFGNFWVEELDVNSDDEAYRTRIDGRVFTAYPVERRLLIPPSAGEFELEPYVAQMEVRLSGNDIRDMFSLGRSQTIIRRTEPIKIRVKPLPSGAPDDFGGAVGSFRMEVGLDRAQAAVNDAVALRLTIAGKGSLRSVPAPTLEPPSGLKVFDPKLVESVTAADIEMTSHRTWEWILVPLAPGEVRLPELRFSYFDPDAAAYRVAESGELLLAVDRSAENPEAPIARGGIQLQRRDLAFIKPLRGELTPRRPRAHQRPGFVASLLVPLALLPVVIVVGRARARLNRDQGLSRSRRARARARKRLQAVRRKGDQMDSAGFHENVARALVEFVADRFNLPSAGLTYDLADELLASGEIDPGLRRRYRSCLETCDFARFVPAAGEAERRAEVLEEASELIERLERAL